MRLELTGRQVEITPILRKKVEKKLAKLDRLLKGGIVSVQAVLAQEKYMRRAEITVHTRGEQFLHGISASNDWETSINDCVEKIVQQLQKVKGKWQERKRRATSVRTLPPAPPDGTVVPEPRRRPRLRRVPRYPVKPMSVDEAALAVEGGDDAFLVFRNAATDAINVVYRRKDGNLGLIEPEN
ncbi:MAG TPA: ribosome-associated translation inhibitor RaiA [Vicinamibacterales bacterium]|nr:ribosome-associated translation inhibitor RaiA [Acidobacteriota bacterium]HOC17392.1 ribosome-associated translation inhibitor RaiA [Vicinamibacterales bacterium]